LLIGRLQHEEERISEKCILLWNGDHLISIILVWRSFGSRLQMLHFVIPILMRYENSLQELTKLDCERQREMNWSDGGG
jgi:hypothetical protein